MLKAKSKFLAKLLGAFAGVLLLAGVSSSQVLAKEVTVSGNDIQAALDEAKTTEEAVTVIIPAGDYTVDRFLYVYSNTIIKADGATIRTGLAGSPLLLKGESNVIKNVTINGGTWYANGNDVFQFSGAANVTITGATFVTSENMGSCSILLRNATNVALTNCTLGAGSNCALYMEDVEQVTLTNITFPVGGVPYSSAGNDNVVFDRCSFDNYVIQTSPYDTNFTYQYCTGIRSVLVNTGSTGFQLIGCNVSDSSSFGAAIMIKESGAVIKDNTITGPAASGIVAENASNLTITGNTISGAGNIAIAVRITGNNTISNNIINGNGKTSISVEYDTNSVIDGNSIDGSALLGVFGDHGEGLVVYHANGTRVLNNNIQNTRSNVANNGNGIIVAYAENVGVSYNSVTNSGNHGIQVSYTSNNVYVENNTITTSGRMGISVSRGSNADVRGNGITDSAAYGIVYDGGEGRCSGFVETNMVTGSAKAALYLNKADVTANYNGMTDNGIYGIQVVNANLKAEGNDVNMSTVRADGYGIIFNSGSVGELINNHIGNYGQCAVSVMADSTVTGTYNTATIQNTTGFAKNAYYIENNVTTLKNNQLFVNTLGTAKAEGQCYYNDYAAGVVIGSQVYETKTAGTGVFTVEYPAQADTVSIVMYVKDENGNAICVNAPNNFDLQNPGSSEPSGDIEKITAFVVRMYETTLGRTPSEEEMTTWVNGLMNRTYTGEFVANGFIMSNELQNKGLSNEEYLGVLYAAFFGRVADPTGTATWVGLLENGASRRYVMAGFVNSVEFGALCQEYGIERGTMDVTGEPNGSGIGEGEDITAFVERLYSKVMERPGDADGIKMWVGLISNGTWSAEDVAKTFFFAEEYTAKNTTNEQFVDTLYQTFMGRDADEDGRNFWVTASLTREEILEGFSRSDEFKAIMASYGL